MKDKKIIVGGIIGLVVIVLFITLFSKDTITIRQQQTVSSDDPIDIALDFYGEWLDAVESTSTTPYQKGLAEAPILSKALRDRLIATSEEVQEIDPALCQITPPTKVSSRTIFKEADKTQILVLSKEPKQAGQAVFALSRLEEGWYIEDILCSLGESDTPREFSFEREGGFFKLDDPLDDQNPWNLLYTQDGYIYTAQLFFNADSVCTDLEGNESTCEPEQLFGTKVHVQGEMSESGVTVKKLKVTQ